MFEIEIRYLYRCPLGFTFQLYLLAVTVLALAECQWDCKPISEVTRLRGLVK